MFGIVDDKRLFDAIKDNSEAAFKVVYEEYFAKLTQFIFKMSRDEDLSEEIVQRTMIKVWEQRDRIILTTSLKSYLYKVSYNEYLMYLGPKVNSLILKIPSSKPSTKSKMNKTIKFF